MIRFSWMQDFRMLATIEGKSSQGVKVEKIRSLLVRCRGPEAKYLVRGLLKGKLRIGVAKMTVLVALAHAVVSKPPAAAQV